MGSKGPFFFLDDGKYNLAKDMISSWQRKGRDIKWTEIAIFQPHDFHRSKILLNGDVLPFLHLYNQSNELQKKQNKNPQLLIILCSFPKSKCYICVFAFIAHVATRMCVNEDMHMCTYILIQTYTCMCIHTYIYVFMCKERKNMFLKFHKKIPVCLSS